MNPAERNDEFDAAAAADADTCTPVLIGQCFTSNVTGRHQALKQRLRAGYRAPS